MLRLYLLAHAPTPAQRDYRFPSDDDGIESVDAAQVERLRARVGACDQIWRGPERRVAETSAALGLTATPNDALRAWSAGRWTGQSLAWIAEHDPDGFRAWRTDLDATQN